MKNGKAAGEDSIIHEVLKIGEFCLAEPITKLLNLTFSSGNYLSNLSRNLLVAIYKGGAKDDHDNYREVSISSTLSKLCSTVLYLRVLEVNESFSLINDKQVGFLKGYRTSDHILLIDTIIHEIVHKCKQRLFVGFIDLKMAYDKVNRHALLCKLRRKGLSGKFLNIIEAMLIMLSKFQI